MYNNDPPLAGNIAINFHFNHKPSQIIPILEISGFGGEALMNFLGSVGDLSKIDDLSQTLTNLTERISQSVSDLTNLKEMSPLSKSTGSLASAPGKLMKTGLGGVKSGISGIGKMTGIKKGKKLKRSFYRLTLKENVFHWVLSK